MHQSTTNDKPCPTGDDCITVSAGALLTNRLSIGALARVLIDAGGCDQNFRPRLPVGYFKTIYNETFSRVFKADAGPVCQRSTLVWPSGYLLRGSSSINGLISLRGQRKNSGIWAAQGAAGGDDWVLPYSRKPEAFNGSQSKYHCISGTLGAQPVLSVRAPDLTIESTHFIGGEQQ